MQKYDLQLVEGIGGYPRGPQIVDSGGVVLVATAGDTSKATLTDASGASLANPVSLTNGGCTFYVANSVASVDLYIMAPGGQFVSRTTVKPGAEPDIAIDVSIRNQVAKIPFSMTDMTAAAEFDTGVNLPQNAAVMPDGVGVLVTTVDATETVDIGLLSSETGGDANGFAALVDVATAGFVPAGATVTVGGTETYYSANTLGALLSDFVVGTNVDQDYGLFHPKAHVGDGVAQSITVTPTAGSDTAEGFIILPYVLAG